MMSPTIIFPSWNLPNSIPRAEPSSRGVNICHSALNSSSINGLAARKSTTSVPCFGAPKRARILTSCPATGRSSYSTSAATRGAVATNFFMTYSLLNLAASALNATGGQTTFNKPFRQCVHDDHRKRRHQRCRHHATPDIIRRAKERVQPHWQRKVAGAGQENGCEEIVVPRHHKAVDKH